MEANDFTGHKPQGSCSNRAIRPYKTHHMGQTVGLSSQRSVCLIDGGIGCLTVTGQCGFSLPTVSFFPITDTIPVSTVKPKARSARSKDTSATISSLGFGFRWTAISGLAG